MNRVLIVGGGPAGMTAAIALARRGIGCEIVEREVDWRPGGIGIGLQSPPMRALRDLDMLDPIIDRAWHHAVIDMMRPDGVKVAEMPQVNVLGPDDPPFVTMSRMTLHEVLAERLRSFDVPVRLGVTVGELDDGAVTFTDGTTGAYDLVVGADGVHSAMRQLLVASGTDARELPARLTERRLERCRLVVEGSLQLSRWEREPNTPGPTRAA